ncbi:hypothetical protein [Aquibium sp. ELW1220]|uniref:hypothetical protein n=1 Tax=Aquibium sp. ELW1220 TaxID=2976766 RepID=UPI0025AFD291|nr:hypothetical protein [Aquibium sp. ELW1220]MDN2579125.1 hypothetical protein [Aquibium sp. ELW1220]
MSFASSFRRSEPGRNRNVPDEAVDEVEEEEADAAPLDDAFAGEPERPRTVRNHVPHRPDAEQSPVRSGYRRAGPACFIFIIFFRNIFGLPLFGERNRWRSR